MPLSIYSSADGAGARSFPGNPYDGHTLAAQIEQTTTLLQDIGVTPTTAIVDLGYRGVCKELAPLEVIHRGKFQVAEPQAKELAQAAPGDRAADRPHQGRSPHGPLLAEGR